MKIGVIGVGKLGSVLFHILNKYYDVVGVDKYDDFSVLSGCDVVFNVVNTPSKKNGEFSNKYLFESIRQAKPYLNCKLFVVVSTVMPGTCYEVADMLDCDVAYNPEFIKLNSIKKDMENPDFVLIGNCFPYSKILKRIYKEILKNNAPIKFMDLKSAELAKISLNSYITMKIGFANTIGRISEKLGTNADLILDAIGTDSRIGKKYFQPGGAYGGPCFPRDNRAFNKAAIGVLNYSKLTDKINKQVAKEVGPFSDDEKYQNV